MADKFASHSDTVMAPSRSAATVIPHATNALPDIPKGVYVGTGGDVTGRLVGDSVDFTWKNVPSGALLPFRFSHIRASSTAADMIAHF